MRILLLLAALLAGAGTRPGNLVDNPSFDGKGAGPVPGWKIRTRPGRTVFRAERGVLVAERGARPGFTADTCFQVLNLPPGTRALRISLRAASRRARGEFRLRMMDRNGGPLGRKVLFHFLGTRGNRRLEKDVLLPPGTWDVEIALALLAEGRVVLDDVDVRPLDPSKARGEARIVGVRGLFHLKAGRTGPGDEPHLTVPLPPPTGTQCPLDFSFRSTPSGLIRKVEVEEEDGRLTAVLALDRLGPGRRVEVGFEGRVLLTGREDPRSLPDLLPLLPAPRLPRRLRRWTGFPAGPALEALGARLALTGGGDLRTLAGSVAEIVAREYRSVPGGPADPAAVAETRSGSPPGLAHLATALFRSRGVPARAIALLPVRSSGRITYGVLAFGEGAGWLRFALDPKAPRPLGEAGHVLLSPAEEGVYRDPARPIPPPDTECGLVELEGPEGGAGFEARETASFVLDRGAGPDLVASLAKAFRRRVRRARMKGEAPRIDPRRLDLSGKAKRLAKILRSLLEEENKEKER